MRKNPRKFTISVLRTLEASGEGGVGPDLVVDLDQALHDNRSDLPTSQSILEAVTEENSEGEGFAKLVWSGGRAWSLVGSGGDVQKV